LTSIRSRQTQRLHFSCRCGCAVPLVLGISKSEPATSLAAIATSNNACINAAVDRSLRALSPANAPSIHRRSAFCFFQLVPGGPVGLHLVSSSGHPPHLRGPFCLHIVRAGLPAAPHQSFGIHVTRVPAHSLCTDVWGAGRPLTALGHVAAGEAVRGEESAHVRGCFGLRLQATLPTLLGTQQRGGEESQRQRHRPQRIEAQLRRHRESGQAVGRARLGTSPRRRGTKRWKTMNKLKRLQRAGRNSEYVQQWHH